MKRVYGWADDMNKTDWSLCTKLYCRVLDHVMNYMPHIKSGPLFVFRCMWVCHLQCMIFLFLLWWWFDGSAIVHVQSWWHWWPILWMSPSVDCKSKELLGEVTSIYNIWFTPYFEMFLIHTLMTLSGMSVGQAGCHRQVIGQGHWCWVYFLQHFYTNYIVYYLCHYLVYVIIIYYDLW